jgi:predicted PurR-regulated permease PerM
MRPTSGLGAFVKRCLIVLLLAALALAAWRLMNLTLLLFAAVLIAIGLRAGSQWVGRSARMGTAGGLVVVVTLLLAALGGALWFFGSVAADQVDELTKQVPAGVDILVRWLQSLPHGQFVLDKARDATASGATGWAGARLAGAASSASQGLGYTALCFVVAVYLAAQPELYRKLCLRMTPADYRARTELLFDKTDHIFRRWLLARLVVMVAIGVMAAIGLWALGVEAAIALGLVGGLLTFIPFIGAILAAAPAILLALTESPAQAVLVLLLFIGIHFVEGNFITPLVHAEVVALPPVVTLLSTVAFTILFGPAGVLLAIPLTLFLMLAVEVFFAGPTLGGNAAAEDS